MKLLPTTQTATVTNYPYGYKKTTATFSLEFNAKKGFRSVFQTVNPATGRLNKPKKSTYSVLIVLKDTDGFISTVHYDFNGTEAINKGCKFVAENFDLFTPEQINYLYMVALTYLRADTIAQVRYAGSKFEDIKPLYAPAIEILVKGIKEGGNLFAGIILDQKAISATAPENYSPFVITERTYLTPTVNQ